MKHYEFFVSIVTASVFLAGCNAPAISSVSSPQAPILTKTPSESPTASAPYRLLPGELVLAANPDDIPAIFANDSLFVDPVSGSEEWKDEEEIVAVEINGQARAYPIRLLSLHEIVNDTVGGQPIAVTWCPLCYSALVFSRVVEEQELTFGVSGFLYKNNLVMFDHQTNSLWSQLLFQSIKGGYNGQPLNVLHGVHTTWGAWKQLYPHTEVLSARQMGRQEEIFDPYTIYYQSAATGIGATEPDPRLDAKTLVIGLVVGEESIAYPFDLVRDSGVINGALGETYFLLVYNPALNSISAFERETRSGVLTFQLSPASSTLVDVETNSIWNPQVGQATKGPLAGEELSRLTAPLVFWFAWVDLHPLTNLVLELP